MNIFTYGALVFPDIWQHCVRNQYAFRDAELRGFKCLKVKQQVLPALIKSTDIQALVSGKVYLHVNEEDFVRIQHFLGKYFQINNGVCFVRGESIPLPCKNFIWRMEYKSLLSSEAWEKSWFEEKALKEYRQSLSSRIL